MPFIDGGKLRMLDLMVPFHFRDLMRGALTPAGFVGRRALLNGPGNRV